MSASVHCIACARAARALRAKGACACFSCARCDGCIVREIDEFIAAEEERERAEANA